MNDDTLTMEMEGSIGLSDFAKALDALQEIVEGLNTELAPKTRVSWVIDDLEAGSAVANIRGTNGSPEIVALIRAAYENMGRALESGEQVPYSPSVQKAADKLMGLIDGTVKQIRLRTAMCEAVLTARAQSLPRPQIRVAMGAVKGTVQTISTRRGTHCVIYDALFDQPIRCICSPEHERALLLAFGKRVIVEGRIKRAIGTGRPVSISDISGIEILPEPPDFRLARGVLPMAPNAEPSEVVIRRLRDG